MQRAWAEIQRLIRVNATHRRKKFKMQEAGLPFILDQMRGELKELSEEPSDPEELADLIGVIIHYALKSGWSIELLENLLLSKLQLRFTEESEE